MDTDKANTESASQDFEALYHRAFAEYGTHALWNLREFEHPTAEQALVITKSLRVEGNLRARSLAEEIERACHAAV
jgi:hypothetical protein